jgi:hypothetical protein
VEEENLEEKLAIINKLANIIDLAPSLLTATARRLLSGEEADSGEWQSLRGDCEDSMNVLQNPANAHLSQTEFISRIQIFWQLAIVATAPDLSAAREVARQIPNNEHTEREYKLGQATIFIRIAKSGEEDQATALYDLAYSIFELAPYAPDDETFERGLEYAAETSQKALEIHLQKGDLAVAIRPASLLTTVATIIFAQFGRADYLEKVLSLSEQIVLADITVTDEAESELCILSHNLANAYSKMAEQIPANAQNFCLRGLKVARRGVDIAQNLQITGPDASIYQTLKRACIQHACIFETNLAIAIPEEFELHGNATMSFLQLYAELAKQLSDPDIDYTFNKFQERICETLHEANPHWLPLNETEAYTRIVGLNTSIEMEVWYYKYIEPAQEQAFKDVDQIRNIQNVFEQRGLIEQTLANWFSEMEHLLKIIVEEIGVNHHTCRLLLVLGAISSGRLGLLDPLSMLTWTFGKINEENLKDEDKRVATRQQMLAMRHLPEEINFVGSLVKLATLTSSFHDTPALTSFIQITLREHNTTLLENVLPQVSHIQQLQQEQTKSNDLKFLLQGLPKEAGVMLLLRYYQLLANNQSSSLSQEDASGDEDIEETLDFLTTMHGEIRNEAFQRYYNKEIGEKDTETEDSSVDKDTDANREVKRDLEIVDTISDDEDRLLEKPEDLIGTEFYERDNPEKKYHIKGILGQGSHNVAFEVIDPDGKTFALKMRLTAFDLWANLHAKIDKLMTSGEGDSATVLSLIDQLLERFPDDAIGWFNKGSLLEPEDLAQALACYMQALSLEPRDVSNYLKAGFVLLKMRKIEQGVDLLHYASLDVNFDGAVNFFTTVENDLTEMIDILKRQRRSKRKARLVLKELLRVQEAIDRNKSS